MATSSSQKKVFPPRGKKEKMAGWFSMIGK